MKKTATLQDIAKLANVSPSTVSRVLNHDRTLSVSPDTKIRIFSAAEELSYERKKPSGSTMKHVGYFSTISTETELDDVYYLAMRVELTKQLEEREIQLHPISPKTKKSKLNELSSILCVGIFTEKQRKWLDRLNIPLLFVDSNTKQDKHDVVYFDVTEASNKILTYFYDKGHRKIAFIGGVDRVASSEIIKDERAEVYREFMQNIGFYNENWIKQGTFSPKSGYHLFKELMLLEDKPTAVFIGNDNLAVGCYNAASELNLSIPEDVSVIGFNDLSQAKYLVPPLTTMRLDISHLVDMTVNLLENRQKESRSYPIKVTIPTVLKKRSSVSQLTVEQPIKQS